MSKIQEYQDLKALVEGIKVDGLKLSQVEYAEGGKVNQIILEGANDLFVSALLIWADKNAEKIVAEVKAEAEASLEQLRLDAKQEAIDFAQTV